MSDYYSSEEIRSIILNAHKIKEFHVCPTCKGTGFVHWKTDNSVSEPGPLEDPEEFPEGMDAECEDCDGIGYKDVTMYSED